MLGEVYYTSRSRLMASRQEGFTKTYNRFHSPEENAADVQKLRDLHVEMDNVVASAYGWADLDLAHDFYETNQGIRFTIEETARREVLQRLLKINRERNALEVAQGIHYTKRAAKKAGSHQKATTKTGKASPALFDMEEDDA